MQERLSLDELIMLLDAMGEYAATCQAQDDPDMDEIKQLQAKLSVMLEVERRRG